MSYMDLISEQIEDPYRTDPATLALVEELMRADRTSLDGLSRAEFARAAREAAAEAAELHAAGRLLRGAWHRGSRVGVLTEITIPPVIDMTDSQQRSGSAATARPPTAVGACVRCAPGGQRRAGRGSATVGGEPVA